MPVSSYVTYLDSRSLPCVVCEYLPSNESLIRVNLQSWRSASERLELIVGTQEVVMHNTFYVDSFRSDGSQQMASDDIKVLN